MTSELQRRDFIKKLIRFGTAGGLVSLGVILSSKSVEPENDITACIRATPCQKCNQFRNCSAPRALAASEKIHVVSDSLNSKK